MNKKKDVFIIGSKGIPAKYGGFESFVENLTKRGKEVRYHIACLSETKSEKAFEYNDAHCFQISVPDIGPAKAIYYDLKSLNYCISYIKENSIKNAIIYILACRIGPFLWLYKKILAKRKINLYVNPDGHEWKREKWSYPVKKYWKLSERLMIKNADLVICDSENIEKYIKKDYKKYNPKSIFIPYGADLEKSIVTNEAEVFKKWMKRFELKCKEYYLVVGRFVPENNYETIIKAFMKSNSNKYLVIITDYKKNKFFLKLQKETNFQRDLRIKFVGTVYDTELLKKIREEAYAYIHGHEVGGTNPSLLEALASTQLNLLVNVCFNNEVGGNAALYWENTPVDLLKLLQKSEVIQTAEMSNNKKITQQILTERYNWNKIVKQYERIFQGIL